VVLLAAFVVYFFRDPERRDPAAERIHSGPSRWKDRRDQAPSGLEGAVREPLVRISIFLSVFDVHVNRAPIAALVQEVTHSPGQFRAAWRRRRPRANEQTLVRLPRPTGRCG